MEDRENPRMRKYGESKTTGIMMATVPHVTSGSGLRKFQADGFLLDRVYLHKDIQFCALYANLICTFIALRLAELKRSFTYSSSTECAEFTRIFGCVHLV